MMTKNADKKREQMLMFCMDAVSYTHLDVYKRQRLDDFLKPHIFVQAGVAKHLNIGAELFVVDGDTPDRAHIGPFLRIVDAGRGKTCLLYTSKRRSHSK